MSGDFEGSGPYFVCPKGQDALYDLSISTDRIADAISRLSLGIKNTHEQGVSCFQSEVGLASGDVIKSIEGLYPILESIPEGSYPLAIVSGITGAFVASLTAALFNFLYLKNVNNRNKKRHFCASALASLDEFEDLSIKYWVTEKGSFNEQDMRLMEVRIKGVFFIMKSSLKEFSEMLSSKEKSEKKAIYDFVYDIYDISTGDGFESSQRPFDKSRAVLISKKCSLMKSKLMRYAHPVT